MVYSAVEDAGQRDLGVVGQIASECLNSLGFGTVQLLEMGKIGACNLAFRMIMARMPASTRDELAGVLRKMACCKDAANHGPALRTVVGDRGQPIVISFDRVKRVAIVIDCSCRPVPCIDTIRQALDISPAEALVCQELAAGHTVKAAASKLSISSETVRSHLKRIFRKVGVCSQDQLLSYLWLIGIVGPTEASVATAGLRRS